MVLFARHMSFVLRNTPVSLIFERRISALRRNESLKTFKLWKLTQIFIFVFACVLFCIAPDKPDLIRTFGLCYFRYFILLITFFIAVG